MTVNFGMMNPYMTSIDADAMMNAPLMSLNSGITSPIAPSMPMMTGMYSGLGNFGMIGGFNPQQQMQYIQQWDNFGIDRQVAAFKNQNNAQFRMQAQNGSIERQAKLLAQEIRANNQDSVKSAYDKLLQTIKSSYGSQMNGNAEENLDNLKQQADRVYAQVNGSYMTDDLKQYGRGSFGDGFMKVFSLGMGNKTSVEENLAYITGIGQTAGSKASNVAGKVLGAICTLGIGLFNW